jgi:hypothetical protein
MTTRATFVHTAYNAYYHRECLTEGVELTHVGSGAPCGEYLRRFWQPIITSEQLQDLPQRLRIMDEDLVVFRDRRGGTLRTLLCSSRDIAGVWPDL